MDHRHVVWDWNGTLLDDVDASVATFNSLLAERSLPLLDRGRYTSWFEFPAKQFYRKCGIVAEGAEWDALAKTYHDRITASPLQRLQPDAVDALEAVRRAGAGQSILSALRQDILERQLEEFGLRRYFHRVCGSDNLDGAGKKDKGLSLACALRGAGFSPAMAGDTLTDAETAAYCGMPCALVSRGHQSAERLRGAGVPVFGTLVEAAAWCLSRS